MKGYSVKYMQTRDIDWFAKIPLLDGRVIPIHVASRGNILPKFVNNKGLNRTIQSAISNRIELPLENRLYDDVEYVGYNKNNEISTEDKIYLSSFGEMAHNGFYSFDTLIVEGRTFLRLVAIPRNNIQPNIFALLPSCSNRELIIDIMTQI